MPFTTSHVTRLVGHECKLTLRLQYCWSYRTHLASEYAQV